MKEEELISHKELHNKIFNCNKCCPVGIKDVYCKDCQKAVIDFMNKYGAGVLTRDEMFEELKGRIHKLELVNKSLTNKLSSKTETINRLIKAKEKK